MITVTVFHVSSDLLMLLIPVPMIARARLPLLRKIILCIIFSLGLLVVLVAILNRYYNFTVSNSLVFLIWYNGEASTAVMVANIPFLWTLLRYIFSLDAWGSSSRRSRNASGAHRLDDRDAPSSIGGSGGKSTGRRQHSALVGVDAATESMERITAHQTGGTSLYRLDSKPQDKTHTSVRAKTSSEGTETDPEMGL